jgi:hypothetical protein
MLTNAVYGSVEVVPPPGAGVETAIFKFPGNAALDAESGHVICVELTKVQDTDSPFTAIVENVVNPVPFSVMVVAVLMGPALGVIEVSVGVGAGVATLTAKAFEVDGLAVGVETVTVDDPAVLRSVAGTVAVSEVPFWYVVVRAVPFHCATVLEIKPVPTKVMVVAEDPVAITFGDTDVSTGVGVVFPAPEPPVPPEPVEPDPPPHPGTKRDTQRPTATNRTLFIFMMIGINYTNAGRDPDRKR